MDSETNFKPINRRNFLRFAALGAGTMVLASIAGKATAQEVLATTNPVAAKKLLSEISRNHGHVFAMTLEKLQANGTKSYNIQGSSGHPHMVDITANVLTALTKNNVVEIESTTVSGHSHVLRLTLV